MLVNKKFLSAFILFFSLLSVIYAAEQVNLIEEAKKSGITLYWDTLSDTGYLEKNGQHIVFKADENFILLNSSKVYYADAPVISDGKILVTKSFIDELDDYFSQDQENSSNLRIGAILIDPGHGGKDPGANQVHKIKGKNVTVREKDINLTVGNMLCSMLKKAYPDKRIIMTRSTDNFLTLQERTEIANNVKLGENEAVLYISVHVNASLDKKAKGFEVWYLTPGYRRTVLDKNTTNNPELFKILNEMMEEEYTTESILIAKFIMDGLSSQIGSKTISRGIKAEEWFVVKNSKMPSVLVELGFLTNYEEACNLNDNAYLQKSALGIYNGISAFVTHFERSRGFTGSGK